MSRHRGASRLLISVQAGIEVGGRKSGCAPPGIGRVLIPAHQLPNPYVAIRKQAVGDDLTSITAWLLQHDINAQLFRKLVQTGVDAVTAGKPIRVECFGGKHRSQAVARAIQQQVADLSGEHIRILLRDAPATPANADERLARASGGGGGAGGGSAVISTVADAEITAIETVLATGNTLTKTQRKNLKRKLQKKRAVAHSAASDAGGVSGGNDGGGCGGAGGGASRDGKVAAAPCGSPRNVAPFVDCFCVLDFEATCDEHKPVLPQEIIEYPTVIIDHLTKSVEAELQVYVKPVAHPALTPFCTSLTGITQADVDGGETWPKAVRAHTEWLLSHGVDLNHPEGGSGTAVLSESGSPVAAGRSFVFVTCGDWDLKTMLPGQTHISAGSRKGCRVQQGFARWINIKKAFGRFYSTNSKRKRVSGMVGMLGELKMPLVGKHHSGIDDCRNIGRVLIRMLEDGWVPCDDDLSRVR